MNDSLTLWTPNSLVVHSSLLPTFGIRYADELFGQTSRPLVILRQHTSTINNHSPTEHIQNFRKRPPPTFDRSLFSNSAFQTHVCSFHFKRIWESRQEHIISYCLDMFVAETTILILITFHSTICIFKKKIVCNIHCV